MRLPRLAALPAALLLTGCGSGKEPVRGTVALADGAPLTKGMVILERSDGPPLTARAVIGPDGRFDAATDKPGDGVPPGRYRVMIASLDLSDVPDEKKGLPYDTKYLRFDTSGLECEVKGGQGDYPIRLEKPKRK